MLHQTIKGYIIRLANFTTVHGLKQCILTKTIFGKLAWTVILLLASGRLAWSLWGLIIQYNDGSTSSYLSKAALEKYEFPPIRFCPKWWLNDTLVHSMNVSTYAVAYAISMLTAVHVDTRVDNVSSVEKELNTFIAHGNFSSLQDFFVSIAYTPDEILSCGGCKEILPIITSVGVCYTMLMPEFSTQSNYEDTLQVDFLYQEVQQTHNSTIYYPAYEADILFINEPKGNFFSLDPIFIAPNVKLSVDITPTKVTRVSTPRQKCHSASSVLKNMHGQLMCKSVCLEANVGSACWNFTHYGFMGDAATRRSTQGLYAAMKFGKNFSPYDVSKLDYCPPKALDATRKCMKMCYPRCEEYMYDTQATLSDASSIWEAKFGAEGKMTVADSIREYQETLVNLTEMAYSANVTRITIVLKVREGIAVYEENLVYDINTFISNAGGVINLLVGASAVSLCELIECFLYIFKATVVHLRGPSQSYDVKG